jgi:spore coat polysaccharide biosynthesis protein SpsF (cytidylyltransferase family)
MEQLKIGFVICSRADSRRVPRKPLAPLCGATLIEHLIRRCLKTGHPVIVAIPHRDYEDYKFLHDRLKGEKFHLVMGNAQDPLARMNQAAIAQGLDVVIRVCHDKIFVEPVAVNILVEKLVKEGLDYVYSSSFVDGAALEVMTAQALARAESVYHGQAVEHISYAIKATSQKIANVDLSHIWKSNHRLLVDYPEDLKVLKLVLRGLGVDCTLTEAIRFLDARSWITKMNRPPLVTVYTCAYNAEKWITKAMGSVSMQQGFNRMEYILIDDASKDQTAHLMAKFCGVFKNSRWITNEKNMGLASSSNVALSEARGKYIIRLDADDYFTQDNAIQDLLFEIEKSEADIVYPDNYFGSLNKVQKGSDAHHVGGALFRTRAANHVKFTDGLRGYEGLDFFVRAREQLKISYLERPLFFYRQHPGSMSRVNLEERAALKEKILESKALFEGGVA